MGRRSHRRKRWSAMGRVEPFRRQRDSWPLLPNPQTLPTASRRRLPKKYTPITAVSPTATSARAPAPGGFAHRNAARSAPPAPSRIPPAPRAAMRRTRFSAGEHGCQFAATLSRRSAMKVRHGVETGPSGLMSQRRGSVDSGRSPDDDWSAQIDPHRPRGPAPASFRVGQEVAIRICPSSRRCAPSSGVPR